MSDVNEIEQLLIDESIKLEDRRMELMNSMAKATLSAAEYAVKHNRHAWIESLPHFFRGHIKGAIQMIRFAKGDT